jgi:hypothetical protein
MAINPLQAPTNYMAMLPQVDLGQQFAEFGQVLAQRQERESALNAQKQYAADLQSTLDNPTQKAWSSLIAKYPGQQKAFESARQGFGEDQIRNEFNEGMGISAAFENKNIDVARSMLQKSIDARKNSGQPADIYQQALDALDSGNIKGAQAGVNMALSLVDPDKFKKIVDSQGAAAKAPSELTEAEAKSKEALAKAESAAIAAGVDQEFARPMAFAKLAETKASTLAPSVRESIDFANLNPAQQATFQALQILKKPPAAVTNVNVSNIDKSASAELGKLVPDLYNQANSAASQVAELPRYISALNSAITGPLAEERLAAAKVANAFGFTGTKAINATREVIQGLSEMALKSRTMLTGQGQITEGEQKLLVKARSGDITFTKGELQTILGVADRAAKAQYNQSRKLLESASKVSPTAKMFLENMQPIETDRPKNVTVDY